MWFRTLLVVCAELVLISPAVAQAQAPLPDSGARVRVTFRETGSARRIVGTLTRQDSDSITLLVHRQDSVQPAASPGYGRGVAPRITTELMSISRPSISRMELSGGWHSSAGKGALVGGGIGAIVGLGLGVAALCSVNDDSYICIDQPGEVVAITLFMGAVGVGIGALVGALNHHEVWRPLDRQPAVTPIIGRVGGATTVGLALRF